MPMLGVQYLRYWDEAAEEIAGVAANVKSRLMEYVVKDLLVLSKAEAKMIEKVSGYQEDRVFHGVLHD
jgi:hypothetical protein